ncbi:MAG: 3'-5' exonuclease [Streptomycetaceae bacterium]|nr:MAG: 3'-5' exonuclease [Streptomycetaceae bacterium]
MDTLVVIFIFGCVGALWMKRKGRFPILGLILGGSLNIFGLLAIYFIKDRSSIAAISPLMDSNVLKPSYSGSRFAQDSGKGALFSYASSSKGNVLPQDYAIVDLETSGLEPSGARVIEIAILLMNAEGVILEEYATLINPGNGEVGPTFIHHITEEAVSTAPTFKEVAGDILQRLDNRIIVAHHAAFEDKFLASEFRRAGIKLPPLPALDTLWLARQVVELPNYKMQTVLQKYGVAEIDLHTALGDVRALASILPKLLTLLPSILYPVTHSAFPAIPISGRQKTRVTNLKKGEKGWISSLLEKLPENGSEITSEIETDYLELLTKVLGDGKIVGEEAKALSKLAGEAGLGRNQLMQLHEAFIKQIRVQAEIDGNIDPVEMKSLENAIKALSL